MAQFHILKTPYMFEKLQTYMRQEKLDKVKDVADNVWNIEDVNKICESYIEEDV